MKTKTNTEISFSFLLTLFYSIPLLALTDGRTDRQTENEYTRFAWAGGTCPRFAWAGFWREALTDRQTDRLTD